MDLNKEISFGRKKKDSLTQPQTTAGNTVSKPKKSGKKQLTFGKVKVPTKNSINLIKVEDNHIHPITVIPSVIVIIILACVISKFAVVDLLTELNAAENRVSTTQSQLNSTYAEIDSFGDLTEKYAHYTFSGLNDTELTTVSREEVMDLLREMIMPYATIGSWSVSYNTISLPITGKDLQEINVIVQRLKEDDRVLFCTVNTAHTDTTTARVSTGATTTTTTVTNDDGTVTANVTIYLNGVMRGAFNG